MATKNSMETGSRKFRELDRFMENKHADPRDPSRVLGAGKQCDDPSQIAASIVDGLNCGIEDLEVIAQNRCLFEGPLNPTAVGNLFTPKINPFTIGTAQGAVDQAQINVDGGELDCNTLITHIGFHMVPPKELMLVEGAVWSPAPTATPVGSIPVVSDAWSTVDANTDGTGTLGLAAGQTLTKAYLDVGEWACDFFYDFVRAYEWVWKIGNNILEQTPLTKIASIRGSAQPYTSGRSRKPFAQYVNDANANLLANNPLVNGIFLPRNATRDGSANVASGHANSSVFSPYGYFEEEVTFGGPGVQELCMNPTIYELCTAQLFPRGVKLGIFFNLIDEFAQARAQRSASLPTAAIVPYTNIVTTGTDVGSGVAPVFTELTSDNPPVQQQVRSPVGTFSVKIGDFYLVAELWGHRVSQTLYSKCIANESAVCDAVTSGTFGRRSIAMMAGK
jgi:hypothetical protein